MVPLTSLWMPILLSAVLVFVASSILHMVLPYHRSDYARVPSEPEVMAALQPFGLRPGDYFMPAASGPKEMDTPAFKERWQRGPVVVMTVLPPSASFVGPTLGKWFAYSVVVGVFAAYLAGRALGPGATYLQVFQFAGCTAFVGYTLALWQMTIWYRRKLSTTVKSTIDGLLYAALTGGAFGWLWPR